MNITKAQRLSKINNHLRNSLKLMSLKTKHDKSTHIRIRAKIKCLKCTNTFTRKGLQVNSFKRIMCPYCNSTISLGEKNVISYLKKQSIRFIHGYIIRDLKVQRCLHFDFLLNDLNIAIECDGGQHYESNKYMDGAIGFKIRKHSDYLKNKYCCNNHIRLIRVPFWKFKDVDNFLKVKLYQIKKQRELACLVKN